MLVVSDQIIGIINQLGLNHLRLRYVSCLVYVPARYWEQILEGQHEKWWIPDETNPRARPRGQLHANIINIRLSVMCMYVVWIYVTIYKIIKK